MIVASGYVAHFLFVSANRHKSSFLIARTVGRRLQSTRLINHSSHEILFHYQSSGLRRTWRKSISERPSSQPLPLLGSLMTARRRLSRRNLSALLPPRERSRIVLHRDCIVSHRSASQIQSRHSIIASNELTSICRSAP